MRLTLVRMAVNLLYEQSMPLANGTLPCSSPALPTGQQATAESWCSQSAFLWRFTACTMMLQGCCCHAGTPSCVIKLLLLVVVL